MMPHILARRPPWQRRLLIAAALAMAALGGFLLWLQTRGGETVERPLVALLPAETAIALQIHDLRALLAAYDASPLAQIIETDVGVGALLLSSGDLQDLREERREAEIATRMDLGRDFLLDWAGRELTLAFVPTGDEPTLVVISQADLGLRERLAELIAQLYPGAQLLTTEHRGIPITTYRGGEPRDSLSFCRFGETVAVALRTDSTEALEAIADAVLAEEPPEQPVFPPPRVPGVHGWVSMERLPRFLASLGSEGVDRWLADPQAQALLAQAGAFREARLTHTLEAARTLRIDLLPREGEMLPIDTDRDWLRFAHPETLAGIHLGAPVTDLGWLGLWSALNREIALDDDWDEERRARRLESRQWRRLLIGWLEDDIAPMLDGAPTFVIDSVMPRFGPPTIRGALVWPTSQPERLEVSLLQRTTDLRGTLFGDLDDDQVPDWLQIPFTHRDVRGWSFQTWQTPVGVLGWTIWNGRLLVTLDDPVEPFTSALMAGWDETVADAPFHRDLAALWGDGDRPAELFIHAQRLVDLSGALMMNAALFSDSARRNLNRVRAAAALFETYPAIGLAVLADDERMTLNLSVTRASASVTE